VRSPLTKKAVEALGASYTVSSAAWLRFSVSELMLP
jgi:hypothetical protein